MRGLVLVSGLPASGKTTLARRLAHELGFVHIWRDGLKRPLSEVWASFAPDDKRLIGGAMDGLINAFAEAVLDAGHGAVVDSNFNVAEQGAAIRELVGQLGPPCFEVCLWGDADALRERFIARADPPLTPDLRPYFERVLARDRAPVLGPPTPTVAFDTTEFAELDASFDALVARIRSALSG